MSEAEDRSRTEQSDQISSAIEKIMANPELIRSVAAALGVGKSDGGAEGNNTVAERGESPTLENAPPQAAQGMERLPEIIATIAPMLSSAGVGGKGGAPIPKDKRACLLAALKPYLSRERCEAIDYMIRLGAISEAFRGLGG